MRIETAFKKDWSGPDAILNLKIMAGLYNLAHSVDCYIGA